MGLPSRFDQIDLGKMAVAIVPWIWPMVALAQVGEQGRHDLDRIADREEAKVCGPRCVQFLLRYYGKEVPSLLELVREIQWPEIERGASLEDLRRSLEKRGIYTYAMRISDHASLKWEFPAVLHLQPAKDVLGHFVVWLPESTENETQVWTGLYGVRTRHTAELASQMSGVVLLTAPRTITHPQRAVRRRFRWPWLLAMAGVSIAGSFLVWCRSGRSNRLRRMTRLSEETPSGFMG